MKETAERLQKKYPEAHTLAILGDFNTNLCDNKINDLKDRLSEIMDKLNLRHVLRTWEHKTH